MQEESVPSYQDRVPLFPGGSCYPLSGEGGSVKTNERLDQLSVIISVIGTPSEEDINSIGKAKDYIATLKKRPGRPIEAQYPAADPLAIDLLKHMLQFNPKKRYTAEEALEHPFLKNVRRADMERGAQRPLVGPEFLETNHVDMDELKRKAYDEVMCYQTDFWRSPEALIAAAQVTTDAIFDAMQSASPTAAEQEALDLDRKPAANRRQK